MLSPKICIHGTKHQSCHKTDNTMFKTESINSSETNPVSYSLNKLSNSALIKFVIIWCGAINQILTSLLRSCVCVTDTACLQWACAQNVNKFFTKHCYCPSHQ